MKRSLVFLIQKLDPVEYLQIDTQNTGWWIKNPNLATEFATRAEAHNTVSAIVNADSSTKLRVVTIRRVEQQKSVLADYESKRSLARAVQAYEGFLHALISGVYDQPSISIADLKTLAKKLIRHYSTDSALIGEVNALDKER